ncbi:MAG: tyrosine-type recombinase/integrase, partial [Thermogutta sp.]|nr:tyrosine-type recombinase/integrase [Thermogutta sp.]
DAVDRELLPRNPFAKLTESVGHDKARDAFVTVEDARKVLEACPDAEWRVLFALARWGALRIPSEIVALTWSDIDWERGRLRVRSPKTEHHAGRGERIIPLFPELRQALEELWDATPEGTVYVINRYRKSTVNLRTQLQRITRRPG